MRRSPAPAQRSAGGARFRRKAGLAVVAALATAAFAARARAEDSPEANAAPAEDAPKVTWKARVEPGAVAPGGQGTLILEASLLKGVHVYATAKMLKVAPKAASGVSYGTPERSKPLNWTNPELPGDPPEDVYFDRIELKVPFTLASDAASPTPVGAAVTFSYCDEQECFPEVGVALGGEVPGPGGAAPPSPTPGGMALDPPAPPPPPGPPVEPPKEVTKVAIAPIDAGGAVVEAWWTPGVVKAVFKPHPHAHVYLRGAQDGMPVSLDGVSTDLKWDAAEVPEGEQSEEPVEASITYVVPPGTEDRAGQEVRVRLAWATCDDSGQCNAPERRIVTFTKEGAKVEIPVAVPRAPSGPTGERIPAAGRIYPDDPEDDGGRIEEKNWIEEKWERWGFLVLGLLFATGIGLAFTPCVLPLIPITVSIVGGGRADMPKARLVVLLTSYVAGLSLTFGVGGLLAGLLGGSVSTAFESPYFLWGLAGVFVFLSLGMFGVYELQPPQWMTRLQGGAKGGSVIGAFVLGSLAAFIASPCTGPVIVGMLVFTAKAGNAVIGFLMFLFLGLGMGAVLFAAGALNLLAKPGPWMVWVRYTFGVIMVAAALYYLASAERLVPPWLFAVGFALAVGVGVAVARHLVRGEGEEVPRAAKRGAILAVLLAAVTGLVAVMTRPPGGELGWVVVKDREALVAEVDKARAEGKSVVVDVWATWCAYCKKYDSVIEEDAELKKGFSRLRMIRIDVTEASEKERTDSLREAVGIPGGQPHMVFVTPKGFVRRSLTVKGWMGSDVVKELRERLQKLGALKEP